MTLRVKFEAFYIQIFLKLPASVPCTASSSIMFQYETWKFYALDAWFTFFIL